VKVKDRPTSLPQLKQCVGVVPRGCVEPFQLQQLLQQVVVIRGRDDWAEEIRDSVEQITSLDRFASDFDEGLKPSCERSAWSVQEFSQSLSAGK
jgi:hypothetical protein